MKQRKLFKGGPKVGEIGFGAMSLGGAFGKTDEAESHRTLDKALEMGLTHVDTALIYGPYVSEEVIGRYLKKSATARKKLVIATKGGIQPQPRAVINERKFMRECLEGSLRRLGVEHVPLYYVHRRQFELPIEDVTETMASFVKEGKIGGIGFSEIAPYSLQRAAAVHHIAAVQNEYSLWTRLPELGLLQTCKKLGTTLVAFSPLGRGAFSNVDVGPGKFVDAFRPGLPRFQEPHWSFNEKQILAFRKLAKKMGTHPAALALAWVLKQGEYIIPIPGTRSPEHLAEFAAAAKLRLTKADVEAIEKVIPIGSAHGNRYGEDAQKAAELYC
jgi:aryl-alcohol dehydrogenase-like predicted oxidoreductase